MLVLAVMVHRDKYAQMGHRRPPAPWGWPVDRTSATPATQNGGDWPTTARRLWLYGDRSALPRHRYAFPWRWVGGVQQGQEVPKHSIVFARPKALQPLTGGKMQCPCGSASHSSLVSCPLLASLAASTPPRLWGGGESRVPPQRPSSHALVSFHEATACALPLDPVRGLIFRYQFGPFPYPAHLVEPAAHGFR